MQAGQLCCRTSLEEEEEEDGDDDTDDDDGGGDNDDNANDGDCDFRISSSKFSCTLVP